MSRSFGLKRLNEGRSSLCVLPSSLVEGREHAFRDRYATRAAAGDVNRNWMFVWRLICHSARLSTTGDATWPVEL